MLILIYASVAQLDRAQDSDSWCRNSNPVRRTTSGDSALLRFLTRKTSLCCLDPPPQSQKGACVSPVRL